MGSKSQFYTNKNIKYLINKYIAEYDIKRAGLYALKELGAISPETFDYWINQSKDKVSIFIGKYLSSNMAKQNDLIVDIVNEFISTNEITPQNIISQKRDAIFTFNVRPSTMQIRGFEFVKKHEYTSYFKIDGYELYYSNRTNQLDIKGIDVRFVKNHPLMEYVKRIIQKYELLNQGFCTYAELYSLIYDIRKKYISFELPMGCYREIAYDNPYCFNNLRSNEICYFSNIPTIDKESYQLIINHNFVKFIVPFINILPSFKSSGDQQKRTNRYGNR